METRWRERLFPRWIWRLPPRSRAVALTFDDGPLPATTPHLLAELDRLQVPSTHFVVGERVKAVPQLLREIRDRGHTIGNHSYRHTSFLLRPAKYQQQSILAAEDAIGKILGARCHYFRPCFGQYNRWTQHVLTRLGYAGVLWSVIAHDWTEQDDEQLWQRLRSRLHEGAIILLHDGHPTTPRVIRLLPRLVDEVKGRGWNFCALLPSALISSGRNT